MRCPLSRRTLERASDGARKPAAAKEWDQREPDQKNQPRRARRPTGAECRIERVRRPTRSDAGNLQAGREAGQARPEAKIRYERQFLFLGPCLGADSDSGGRGGLERRVYSPRRAAPLHAERWRSDCCPASTLAGSPSHAFNAGAWSARSERERELPRLRAAAVHGVEPGGGLHVALAAGEEDDAGHGRGNVAAQAAERQLGDLFVGCLRRAVVPGENHVRLEERAFERDPLVAQLRVDGWRTREVTWNDSSIVCVPSIRISGSTIGTSPASWLSAAYRASACAFVQTAYPLGSPSPIEITARHFANRAPSPRYSSNRSRSPSRPSVIVSPGRPRAASRPCRP